MSIPNIQASIAKLTTGFDKLLKDTKLPVTEALMVLILRHDVLGDIALGELIGRILANRADAAEIAEIMRGQQPN